MFNNGYPTSRFTWKDNSGGSTDVLFSAPDSGLNVPFAFLMAERGVPGAIYFGGSAELVPALGASTFDFASPYFNAATQFAGIAMAGQGVEVMRLVDPDATVARLGLFLEVTNKTVTQYQKASDGTRLLDSGGNPKPVLEVDGTTPVTEPGVKLKWTVRALQSEEVFDALTPVTVSQTTKYPIIAFEMTSPGGYGNRQGFKLYSTSKLDSTVAQAINSVLYRFVPMELPTAVSTTASPIPDIFGSSFNDVSFKPSAIYGGTATNYGFNAVLGNAYTDINTGNNTLPYNVHVYGANIATIGTHILSLSPELDDVTDPYMLDLISATDLNGLLYDHIELDPASSTVVNASVTNYALGGADGDTSWEMFESLVADWCAGSDHGEFTNLQQHPMTHYSDPGFSVATKTLLLNMLDLRDNFKIDLATQDISLPANTKAEDISAGQTLAFRAQMHPESTINGVGCCRVGIYAHAAELVSGAPTGGLVPFNLNRLIQRRNLDGGTYIKGSSGGIPNSVVTIFRKPNWVADDETSQALSWANAINTVRHASRTTIFYPALRTVYPTDTSLLSDDEVVDRIIYMFKICREIWAKYAGVRQTPKKLYPLIERDINNQCAAAFSGDNINVAASVFQTAADANLGYQISVNLAVTGTLPMRTMNFNVIVGRETAA